MYLYIYDTFLNNKKYNNILTSIESRLNDLGIKGKTCRLNLLKNLKEIIEEAVISGITNIIAVGDDSTFSKIINNSADLDVVVGYIPVIKNSKVAEILGLPHNIKACDVIAQRIIKKIDLGKVNNIYFINSAEIFNEKIIIKFKNFEITPINNNLINFCNLGILSNNQSYISNPSDGYLEAIITPIKKGLFYQGKIRGKQSIFPFTKIKIDSINRSAEIKVDDQKIVKTPAEIKILPKKLNVIAGSLRKFD